MQETPCFTFRESRCQLVIGTVMVLSHGWRFIGMATLDLEEGFISRRHKHENTQGACPFLWGEYPIVFSRFTGLG